MSLEKQDKKNAQYLLSDKFDLYHYKTRTFDVNREHLPLIDGRDAAFTLTNEEWNNLIDLLANAASSQPFGEPYYWQSHEKASFARWLRSWKV